MKRVSSERLKSMEAAGAKVHRLESANAQPALAISPKDSALLHDNIDRFYDVFVSISESIKPQTIYKDVPVEVPVSIDYEFVIHRDDNGLIATVDMMDGDSVAGHAVFRRDKNYRVTGVTTEKV